MGARYSSRRTPNSRVSAIALFLALPGIAAVASTAAMAQQTFKWTDEQGQARRTPQGAAQDAAERAAMAQRAEATETLSKSLDLSPCIRHWPSDFVHRPLLGSNPRCLINQTRAALTGEIAPEPLVLHAALILQLRQKHDVNKRPDEPRNNSCELDSA